MATGHTWVTRKGVKVDRIASVWLIRRFLDEDADIQLVDPKTHPPRPGERRLDLPDAEFNREGDRCLFEVLLERFGVVDSALDQIAEIVHDLHFDNAKFDRPDPIGLGRLVDALVTSNASDEERLEKGAALLDRLYDLFAPHYASEASP